MLRVERSSPESEMNPKRHESNHLVAAEATRLRPTRNAELGMRKKKIGASSRRLLRSEFWTAAVRPHLDFGMPPNPSHCDRAPKGKLRPAVALHGAVEHPGYPAKASLMRFGRAVFGQYLQAGHEHDIDHLIIAVGLINDHLPPCRGEGGEIFMFDGNPTAVGDMDQKRAKRLRVQEFANFFDLHLGNSNRDFEAGKITTWASPAIGTNHLVAAEATRLRPTRNAEEEDRSLLTSVATE